MGRWLWVVTVLLLSAGWAVQPPATVAQSDDPVLTDPEGDAYERSARDLAWEPWYHCYYTLGLESDDCDAMAPPAGLPAYGPPGPPELDIVALHLDETPTDLVVRLGLAGFDAAASEMPSRLDGDMIWTVCWHATECVMALAWQQGDTTEINAYLIQIGADLCDVVYPICLAPLDVAFEAGTPGHVVWTVPRALLHDGSHGAALPNVTASTGSNDGGDWTTWSVTSPIRSRSGTYASPFWSVDRAGGDQSWTFQTRSQSRIEDLSRTAREDDVHEAPFPDADIQRIAYVETTDAFTVAMRMARVGPSSPPFALSGYLAFARGAAMLIDIDRDATETDMTVEACGDETCSYRVPAAARLDVVSGAPGWINVTFDRTALGSPPAGTQIAGAWFGTQTSNQTRADNVPAAEATVTMSQAADFLAIGPVYALRLDSDDKDEARRGDTQRVLIRDNAHDAASDAPAVDTSSGMFDLVLAGVEGTSPTSSRVTIGVRDLSRIAVPAGMKAVTYAVAIETDAGPTMVGFYHDDVRNEFFCASDTLVLPDDKRDPAQAAWTTLDGVLSVARDGGGAIGGDAGAPSTLVIFVPHSCFGTDAPGTIEANSFKAAIHAIPQSPVAGVPLQRIETVDEAHDETVTAFTLGTALPPAEIAPWYERPFGIDGFWDLVGIALAIMLPLAGLLLVRHRRNALRRYMEAIDHVLATHRHESKAREQALLQIRHRLNDDAARGRINESSFLLVETRLLEHLRQTRLHELTETFGELPHRLLHKLVDMLVDGTITEDEARRFGALLEDSELTKAARERIRRKVAHWVVEDAAAGAARKRADG